MMTAIRGPLMMVVAIGPIMASMMSSGIGVAIAAVAVIISGKAISISGIAITRVGVVPSMAPVSGPMATADLRTNAIAAFVRTMATVGTRQCLGTGKADRGNCDRGKDQRPHRVTPPCEGSTEKDGAQAFDRQFRLYQLKGF